MTTNAPSIAPPKSNWPAAVAAIGGAMLGLGAIGLALAFVVPGFGSDALEIGVRGLLAAGGAVLAIGWIGLALRGTAGFMPALGAVLVPGAVITALVLEGGVEMNLVRGLVLFGAFIGCAITFYFGLGEARFASLWLARLGAILAVIGLGGLMFAFSRTIDMPMAVGVILALVGLGGIGIFGLALAFTLPAATRNA